MSNAHLNRAKKEKNDEFYTRLEDIEKELSNYEDYFEDKVVYCNCDDYRFSNFFKYFVDNFNQLKLKKLICTGIGIGDKTPRGIIINSVPEGFVLEECSTYLSC